MISYGVSLLRRHTPKSAPVVQMDAVDLRGHLGGTTYVCSLSAFGNSIPPEVGLYDDNETCESWIWLLKPISNALD